MRKIIILILWLILIFGGCIYSQSEGSRQGKTARPKQTEEPTTEELVIEEPATEEQKITPELRVKIEKRIKELGSDDWQKREAAQSELLKIGLPAQAFLEKALKESGDAEIRLRVTQLLKQIPATIAEETIIRGIENFTKSKGYRFKGEIKMSAEGIPMEEKEVSLKIEVIQQNPDLTYAKVEGVKGVEGLEGRGASETYRKGNKIVYKEQESGKWKSNDTKDTTQPFSASFFRLFPDKTNKVKGYLENVRFCGEEKVENVECKVIEAFLSPEGVKKALSDGHIIIGKGGKFTTQYKVWVGKKDNLIYRAVILMEMEMEIDMPMPGPPPGPPPEIPSIKMKTTTVIKFSDYNKDIEIKIPEEVSKLLEIGDKSLPDKGEGTEKK